MGVADLGIGYDPFDIAEAFDNETSGDGLTIRMGMCVSLQATTCTITLAGTATELAGIRYMGPPPRPGSPVRVARQGKLVFVIGTLSGVGPAPFAMGQRTANQSCASGVTNLSFPTEVHDPWDMFTNTSTITLPCDGVWHGLASAQVAANANGYRELTVMINGAGPASAWSMRHQSLGASVVVALQASRTFAGNKGDTVTVALGQTSGGALNVNPATLALHWVGSAT